MKKIWIAVFAVFVALANFSHAQIPTATLAQIVRAEDERRFDKTLEALLANRNEKIRERAALAAGRIGDDRAVSALAGLLEKDSSAAVRATAAFAVGEIESAKGAGAILKTLGDEKNAAPIRARAVEAAGKIAAAIAASDKKRAEELGEAILDAMDFEARRTKPDRQLILLGLTAILRARPAEGDAVAAKFLTNLDSRIRADAANTLARLRSKNHNDALRAMLLSDEDPIARANAARVLGAAEDKNSLALLTDAALEDEDARVRVSAIRALAGLKDKTAAEKLIERGEKLLSDYKKSRFASPSEKNELLEIAASVGRILQESKHERAVKFLSDFRAAEKYRSPEIEIAFARVFPTEYLKQASGSIDKTVAGDWRAMSSIVQGLAETANLESVKGDSFYRDAVTKLLREYVNAFGAAQTDLTKALPDALRGYAAFKPGDLEEVLRRNLADKDLFVRAAAAELLAEQPAKRENFEALQKAYDAAVLTDKDYNDAQLAIMDALFKLDKKESVPTLLAALDARDYLVRKKAFELLRTKDLEKDWPEIPTLLERAAARKKDLILPYEPAVGSKLGQILNAPADYARAVSRKNGQTRALVATEKGVFTIEFFPEDAPLAVDNFIKLAKSGYYDNVQIHRVVPNFVVQDGDPRGDGSGGPGWQIRCEINRIPYERGMVGMALSGKDTGGSQWFVTHSPQPHLDGGYTIFGRVGEDGMKIVDNLTRGDKILSVKIVEGADISPKTTAGRKAKTKR
jgi:cyclophilin family peptidyl-prolyl cis-trans isomerase/HEAT repeat protein